MKTWYLYIVKCNKGSLYTGISTDVKQRITDHEQGNGAKYLKGRGPLELLFSKRVGKKQWALKIENIVKRYSKEKKEQMIKSPRIFEELLQKHGFAKDIRRGKAHDVEIRCTSLNAISQLLNKENRALLKKIIKEKPTSISHLSRITGRDNGNLNKTLHKMALFGLIELKNDSRKMIPIVKARTILIEMDLY